MKPWMAVLIVIVALAGGVGLLVLVDGQPAASKTGGSVTTSSDAKIETISKGSKVEIQDHLKAGRFTIVEFTADW